MPDCDHIFKHFRIRGKDLCVAFDYFDHSVGIRGTNKDKVEKIYKLSNGGKNHVLVLGDFNAIPAEWSDELLDRLGMQLITPQVEFTCKIVTGNH